MIEKQTKLKVCPFCGGEPITRQDPWNGEFFIECCDCTCIVGVSIAGEYSGLNKRIDAIEAWNNRKDGE